MKELNPTNIYESFQKGKLDISTTVNYLISFIENEKDNYKRYQAIDFLSQIELSKQDIFKFIENVIISEGSQALKDKAIGIMIKNYPHKSVKIIKYLIGNDSHQYYKQIILDEILSFPNPIFATILSEINHIVVKGKGRVINEDTHILGVINKDLHSIKEIQQLEKLKINQLILNNNKINSLEDISYYPNIKCLELRNNDLTSLNGIEHFPALKKLSVAYNHIKDVENLRHLKNMKYINLRGNPLTKLNNVINLLDIPTLKIIEIERIEEVNLILEELANNNQIPESLIHWIIRTEICSGALISKLIKILDSKPTSEYQKIKSLILDELCAWYIEKYSIPTEEAVGLELLCRALRENLGGFSFEGVPYYRLGNSDGEIEIEDNHVIGLKLIGLGDSIDEKYLEPFTFLKRLHLEGGSLTSFSNIRMLEFLRVSGDQHPILEKISDVKGLKELKNLKVLDLSFNEINSCEGLEVLEQLESLILQDNHLNNVDGPIDGLKSLIQLKNLKQLDVSDNFLFSVQGLEKLGHLQELNVSRQKDVDNVNGQDFLNAVQELKKLLPNTEIIH